MNHDKLNKLWEEYIEKRCPHRETFKHEKGTVNCIECGRNINGLPDHTHDPNVFKRCVVDYDVEIEIQESFQDIITMGNEHDTIEVKYYTGKIWNQDKRCYDEIVNPNPQHAVMLVVLKVEGVDVYELNSDE